jgi:hypothetical protein
MQGNALHILLLVYKAAQTVTPGLAVMCCAALLTILEATLEALAL